MNLTQEELGARVGITLSNMSKLFKAMDVNVRIEISEIGTFVI